MGSKGECHSLALPGVYRYKITLISVVPLRRVDNTNHYQ